MANAEKIKLTKLPKTEPMTVQISIEYARRFKVRLWVAGKLFRLGGFILGNGLDVELVDRVEPIRQMIRDRRTEAKEKAADLKRLGDFEGARDHRMVALTLQNLLNSDLLAGGEAES